MRFSVHAPREAADDDDALTGELSAEKPRHLRPVRRAGASADDRDGRPSKRLDAYASAHEETGRWVVDGAQERREVRVGARKPANAVPLQTGEVRALVEPPGERPKEPIAQGLPHEVPVRLRRERRQRQIAHAEPSSVGDR